MDFKNLSVFSVANQNIQYLSAKQKIIAENIANVNTPGYLARQVEKQDFDSSLFSTITLQTTNPKHIGLKTPDTSYRVYTPNPAAALTIDAVINLCFYTKKLLLSIYYMPGLIRSGT